MRNKLNIILLVLIITQISPVSAFTNPQKITISIFGDGVTRLDYLFQANITSLQTNLTLLGEEYGNIFIVNEDGLPLEYIENDDGLTIYSLGSTLVNLTYLTSELTSKSSVIWSLEVTVPISTKIVLPQGATIINLNVIPLEIETLNEKTALVMPSGQVKIDYTLDILGSETLAEDAINIAEEMVQKAENEGAIITLAKDLLLEAISLFQQESYIDSEEKATQALELVHDILEKKTVAEAKITATEVAIQIAKDSGNTLGLDIAESLFDDAQEEYQSGDYDQAIFYADQALEAAVNSDKEANSILIIAAGLIIVAAAGGYIILRRKISQRHTSEEIEIDLERIFEEHPELRMDDREVIKYLAENDGEAFAFDIRDRFNIPRTSAWRMIQRLQRFEVVDERKVGGQSLINIKEKYRRQP
jgi:uncharacterized membrane protein